MKDTQIVIKRFCFTLGGFFLMCMSLWSETAFKNDICVPSKLYMLSGVENRVYVEAILKRWRPYNDFVRFSGTCTFSEKLHRVASVENPENGTYMLVDLVNSDNFQVIKEDSVTICVGKKGSGSDKVTVQILGDSFVNGAFFKEALLTQSNVPGIEMVGLRNVLGVENQYDEGRGGWTVKKYFEIPKGGYTSYHGYMQPEGDMRYWGDCIFWQNCFRVKNGEIKDWNKVYDCSRYDRCLEYFDEQTGFLLHPRKNDLMYDSALQSYMIYDGKQWVKTIIDEDSWKFNYGKYLEMWKLEAPQFFGQMLGLNDFRDSLSADYTSWNERIAEMKESYYKAVPKGKFMILIPCSTCGSLDNVRGDFTLRQNAAMWQLRKNIIDTFDNRESEGYYLVDVGITIDNENGYRMNNEGLQVGNPHPYPNYPTMGIPIAAFIQYFRGR